MHGVRNQQCCALYQRVEAVTVRLRSLHVRCLGVAALGLGVSLVDVGLGLGFASDRAPESTRPVSIPKPASPAQVYRSACLRCHDSDGRGQAVRDSFPTIPDFTNLAWHASRGDEDLGRTILNGKGPAMSPMKKKLESLDVMQMVSFVRGFRGGGVIVLDSSPSPSSAPEAEPGD